MKRVIYWFRRDLRLTDNIGLRAACDDAEEVIPVYILSTWRVHHCWTGAPRQQFLCSSLEALARSLDAIGGRLIFREEPADEALETLLQETKAEAIYYNRDPDPYGRAMEKRVRKMAAEQDVKVREFKDVAIHERDEVLTGSGKSFRVFTAYARAWAKLEKPDSVARVTKMHTPAVRSVTAPDLERWGLAPAAKILPGGEKAARQRMERFFDGRIIKYAESRDFPSEGATSRLSQDLRFGLISARELYRKAREIGKKGKAGERKSVQLYLTELVWREFYFQILWHHPEVQKSEFNPKYRGIGWEGTPHCDELERWKDGETGFPIVDAAMRQLEKSGFMHNRLRMITAMFLTKDLHLDWREGEMHFMQKLVDGEIAANNGGWQWNAGTGADAAPHFRVQNPWLQSERFDPEGAFIKQWLPELRDVPAAKLHKPPHGLKIAKSYPLPMVDHGAEREKAIEMFRQASGKTKIAK